MKTSCDEGKTGSHQGKKHKLVNRNKILFSLAFLGLATLKPIATAAPIAAGQTLTGQRFEWQSAYSSRSDGTYGQYEISMQAGTQYTIFTANPSGGNTKDTFLYLLNSAMSVVASDNNSGGERQASITFTPPSSGTYYIRLRADRRGRYGFCSLTVTAFTAPGPNPIIAIDAGDTLHNQYFAWESAYSSRPEGSYATYSLDVTAGQVYTITTSNAGDGNTTDTFLYLLNSSGAIVTSDDDSNGNLASRMVYQASSSGTYFVKIRAYTRGTYGYCTLAVVSNSQGSGNPLYPDLITWQDYLEDAEIVSSGSSKLLRFSNSPANIGRGDMILYGVVQPDGTTYAYQRVRNDNGTFTDYLVGTFMFEGHEDHNHWHFDDFADYNLRRVASDGGLGPVVATSGKVTFCLLDSVAYDLSLPGAPRSPRYTCSNQGISIGWADVYSRGLTGQNINITAVPDGTYWLESIADPSNRLLELNDGNNAARIKIQINKANNSVRILQ